MFDVCCVCLLLLCLRVIRLLVSSVCVVCGFFLTVYHYFVGSGLLLCCARLSLLFNCVAVWC